MSTPPVEESAPGRAQPPGTFKIGSVAGVDVLVRSSWLIVAMLIAVILAPRIEQVQPGLGALKYVAGVAFAVLLYLSVLLHEISHAVVAQRCGLGVRSITLHFLGGATEIDSETRTPGEEFKVAVVGPVTSIGIGLVALALSLVVNEGLLGLAVNGLAYANLVVGVLNLVPGLPLDGGRVLKSLVWALSRSSHRGTIAAGWGGRVAALAALSWPAVARGFGIRTDLFDYLMAAVVASFLWGGATASIASARIRRQLPQLRGRELARRAIAVPDDLPLSEAVRRAQEAHAGAIVIHAGAERLTGIVNEVALQATPEERRPWIPVSAVARTLEEGLILDADISGEELVRAMVRTPAAEYVLVEADGTVHGVLTSEDVERAFAASGTR